MLSKRKKKSVMGTHQAHDTDTGSAGVQIGLLTARIDELAAHLKKHPKDNHSRRGLLQMVGKRRHFLQYVERKDKKKHDKLVKEIKL